MTALDPTTPGPTTPGPVTPESVTPESVTPSPAAPESAELAERLRTALQHLLPALRGARGEHGDLTPSRQAALGALATHGSMRISTLATRLGIALPTTSRMVELLDAADWIERTPDPEDRRASLIALTDTGRELLRAVRHEAATRLATRIDKLSPEERHTLSAALPALESLAADGSAAATDPERR